MLDQKKKSGKKRNLDNDSSIRRDQSDAWYSRSNQKIHSFYTLKVYQVIVDFTLSCGLVLCSSFNFLNLVSEMLALPLRYISYLTDGEWDLNGEQCC